MAVGSEQCTQSACTAPSCRLMTMYLAYCIPPVFASVVWSTGQDGQRCAAEDGVDCFVGCGVCDCCQGTELWQDLTKMACLSNIC